jgi:hypothetical protein
MLVDPTQFRLKGTSVISCGTQHTKASCLGHLNNDIATMTKRYQGEFDIKQITD